MPKGPKAAKGVVNLTLDSKKKTVCWTFAITGLSGASAAHIHKGKPGTAGAVVVPLGTTYKKKGCTKASKMADRRDRVAPERVLRERPHGEVPGRRNPRAARRRNGSHVGLFPEEGQRERLLPGPLPRRLDRDEPRVDAEPGEGAADLVEVDRVHRDHEVGPVRRAAHSGRDDRAARCRR